MRDHVERGVAEPSATKLMPFALLRVAAIPYDHLVELTPSRTTDRIEAAPAATTRLEEIRPRLEGLLFDEVPVADRRLRSRLLVARRAVHRAELLTGQESFDDITTAVGVDAGSLLAEWVATRRWRRTSGEAPRHWRKRFRGTFGPELHAPFGQRSS